jgi:hypothetical protein
VGVLGVYEKGVYSRITLDTKLIENPKLTRLFVYLVIYFSGVTKNILFFHVQATFWWQMQ